MSSSEDLKIAGSFIRYLTLVPGKKLEIRLLHGPVDKAQREVVEEISLEFLGLTICSFYLSANPWIEVVSLEIEPKPNSSCEVESVNAVGNKQEAVAGSQSPQRFSLICCEGRIEIVAEQFSSTIVDDIPFVDRNSRRAGSSDARLSPPLDESGEKLCAFCGRKSADVSKMIIGSEANICAECVRTCVDLIDPSPNETPT